MKKLTAILLLAAVLLSLVACGSSAAAETYDMEVAEEAAAVDYAYDYEADNGWTSSTTVSGEADVTGQDGESYQTGLKIIKTGDISVETEDYDETDAMIRSKVSSYGGMLQESYVSGSKGSRYGSYTVRIPSASFDSFFYDVTGSCVVTYQSISSEDVTEQYTDLSTRLETDRKKYERLLELLDKAETLSDIYSIQSEISDVEYEIDSITGTLNGLDSRVAYSTIYISVNETVHAVAVAEDPGFGARMKAAFRNGTTGAIEGLQNFAVAIARGWFGWLCLIIVVLVVVLVIRGSVRRHKRAEEAAEARWNAEKEKQAAEAAARRAEYEVKMAERAREKLNSAAEAQQAGRADAPEADKPAD